MAAEEIKVPLLVSHLNGTKEDAKNSVFESESFGRRFWVESKKLWRVVGPAILARLATFSINMITLAFAGHLGNTELASVSIICNVITGFDFGLLLGMASALETLCGQAYGAKQYHMLGVYMQRSWIVLFGTCIILLPIYIFATPILKLLGQPDDVAELSGYLALCIIPVHFGFAFVFPLQRFLQCQLKNAVNATAAFVSLAVHIGVSYWFVYGLKLGVVGAAVALNISWWVFILGMFLFTVCGGCPETWKGFSMEAFTGLWDFLKISASSGVMLCLENWYYRILILMTGNLKNVEIAVDALSVCMAINGWEMSIPLSFFAGTG
ncbi:hypothetical protein ACJIZ3_023219 [Penstemon smallii]|uniref:Multidrug resistance protein NorM n=1 Tax=Penstemon smallii TaxID=265156 RepID=A0ABD3TQH6_9LAMI